MPADPARESAWRLIHDALCRGADVEPLERHCDHAEDTERVLDALREAGYELVRLPAPIAEKSDTWVWRHGGRLEFVGSAPGVGVWDTALKEADERTPDEADAHATALLAAARHAREATPAPESGGQPAGGAA